MRIQTDSVQSNRNMLSYLPEFLKRYVKEAVEFPDLDTLSSMLGIKVREAEKLVIKNNEELAGYKVREVFCTKEARELKNEILGLLASYAITKNGRELILTRTPTLDRKELQKRFDDVHEGERLKEVLGDDKIGEVREILSKAEIENMSLGKSPLIATRTRGQEAEIKELYDDFVRVKVVDSVDKVQELLKEEELIFLVGDGEDKETFDEPGIVSITEDDFSDICVIHPEFVVNSFKAKKKVIKAVIQLLTDFEELKSSRLFNGISVSDLEEVMAIIEEMEAGRREGETSFDEVMYRWEEALNKEIERIMRRGGGADDFKAYLDEVVMSMGDELMLTGVERDILRESAYENLERGPPFEFSRGKTEVLRERYNRRMRERWYYRCRDSAKQLEGERGAVSSAIRQLFHLDLLLAVSRFTQDFGLTIPEIVEEGLGVIKGRNIFLLDEELKGGERVVPVSYSVGKTGLSIFGATPHPVAILTGANSGGKTSLLVMLASSVILTELGLPVPAERAEIPLLPLYVYRRKMIKKTGSFEYSMRALSRIFIRRGAKVVLIDELEALTEPGPMGRIMASLLNNLPKDTLAVVITHLIHELLPHISVRKVRVDGIESEGLDAAGNIIVNRQPIFNHIGSSTPELVIAKLLGRVRKAELKRVYEEILKVLEKEREEWG
ncbi:MAG: P-loop NTPase family protein [Candidatus Methanospirareceae archaeon]